MADISMTGDNLSGSTVTVINGRLADFDRGTADLQVTLDNLTIAQLIALAGGTSAANDGVFQTNNVVGSLSISSESLYGESYAGSFLLNSVYTVDPGYFDFELSAAPNQSVSGIYFTSMNFRLDNLGQLVENSRFQVTMIDERVGRSMTYTFLSGLGSRLTLTEVTEVAAPLDTSLLALLLPFGLLSLVRRKRR